MKVLHIIPSVSPLRGGPSKAIIEMVRALNDDDIEAEIATTNDHGNAQLDVPLNTLLDHQGVPIRFFERFSPALRPLREFAYSGSFRRWLAKHIGDYDLIHIHALFSFPSSYAMWLARKNGVKYLVRPIGQLEDWSLSQSRWRKRIFLSLFDRKSLAKASAIHFTAESEMRQSEQSIPALGRHGIPAVIPLGVSIPNRIEKARDVIISAYGLRQDKKILLFLSRIHPKKGLELLLDALQALDPSPWQLVVAGDGDRNYVNSLKDRASQNNVSDDCHFIGFVKGDNKHTLLQGADLYALTSYSENFGIAVLEALAAGTPALVSRDVALSKPIESENLGFVCDTDVESITSALQRASDQLSAASDGHKISDYVSQHYSWAAIAKSLNELYQTIYKAR